MITSVGLDIGWKNIKAVELTDDFKVTKIGKIEIPRPIKGDENEIYAAKIKELFDAQRFSMDNVIINLRGSYILARTYVPPSSNKDDFERWFVESIESLIPGAPISDVIYGHQFLDSGRVLISFARLGVVKNRIKILEACGIFPAAIDASCLALYHAFENHGWIKEKRNFAIIDIGGLKTDLLIVKEGEPFVSTEIAFGGRDIKRGRDKHKVFVQTLAAKLEKTFNFYKDKEGLKVEGLIFVGDYSKIPGLKKNLSNILKIKIEIGRAFKLQKIGLPSGFNNRHRQYYAQAFGLALKGLNNKKGINLMPHETKELYKAWQFDKRTRNFFKKSARFSGFILITLIFLLGILLNNHRRISREVENLKLERNELLYVNNEEKELTSKILKLKQLGNERFLWSQILYNLGKAVPTGVYFKDISTEFRLVSTGEKPVKERKVVVEGDARNSETVIKFIKNLEKYFKNIVVDKIKGESMCEFKISLTI